MVEKQRTERHDNGKVLYEPIFTARQPVFDREGKVWGFELFFRHSANAGEAEFDDATIASVRTIADGFTIVRDSFPPDSLILINLTEQLLADGAMLAVPPQRGVAELTLVTGVSPGLIESLEKLKLLGYMVALDNFTGQPELMPLLDVVDVVKVDVSALDSGLLFPLVSMVRQYSVSLLAKKIESGRIHTLCRSMGFSYFQGYHFGRPEVMAGRKVSSAQMVKMEILRQLNSDYNVQRLADCIKQDVSLSYRLLRYVNSASVGLRSSVRALDQALVVLGERVIRHWLMVVLLADLNPTPGAREVSFWSVQRARLLYLLAEANILATYGPETMFLIGLFSRLDYLLGKPMCELVTELPLDGLIKDAYCGKKNFVRDVLDFLTEMEQARWETTAVRANWLGIPLEIAADLSNEALRWTAAILADETAGEPED